MNSARNRNFEKWKEICRDAEEGVAESELRIASKNLEDRPHFATTHFKRISEHEIQLNLMVQTLELGVYDDFTCYIRFSDSELIKLAIKVPPLEKIDFYKINNSLIENPIGITYADGTYFLCGITSTSESWVQILEVIWHLSFKTQHVVDEISGRYEGWAI